MMLRWQIEMKGYLFTYMGDPDLEDLMTMFRCSIAGAAWIKVEKLNKGHVWELFEMIVTDLQLESIHQISKETQFANALADFYAKK